MPETVPAGALEGNFFFLPNSSLYVTDSDVKLCVTIAELGGTDDFIG